MHGFPKTITAGTTFEIRLPLTAYPAPAWKLFIILRGAGEINLEAAPDGNAHRVGVPAAETAQWVPGKYWYVVRVELADDAFEISSGTLDVRPDFASMGAGYNGSSHVERVLAAIEAVLERRATLDQQRYKINNRELERTSISDLLKLRDIYRAELKRMKCAGNLFDQKAQVRFR